MNGKMLFELTTLPTTELLLAILAGVYGVLTDQSSHPVFSFVLYALSFIPALGFRPLAGITKAALTWIFFVVGIGIVLLWALYFSRQIQVGFDIFLIPLGLGIAFAAIGSLVHRGTGVWDKRP